MTLHSFDKNIIAHNFSKASRAYEEESSVQKIAAKNLVTLAESLIKDNDSIIDIGSGTSAICRNITSSEILIQKNLQLFELDLSLKMLENWEEKPSHHITSIIGDGEHLPLKTASLNMIISSFALQWLTDFETIFTDCYRVLKKGGMLAFCIPCSSSLQELKAASVASGCHFHFNALPEIEDVKSKLQQCGFQEKRSQSEILKSEFDNGIKAIKSLKKIGANYFNDKSSKRKPISKKQLQHFDSLCLNQATRGHKKFAISWEVSYFVFYKI